jgi:hypothetical protein
MGHFAHQCEDFQRPLGRDAQKPDWLLERAEFELSGDFSSLSLRQLFSGKSNCPQNRDLNAT